MIWHLVDEGGEEGVFCSLQIQLVHLLFAIFILKVILKVIRVIIVMVIKVIILVIITLRPFLQTKLSSAPHLVKIIL